MTDDGPLFLRSICDAASNPIFADIATNPDIRLSFSKSACSEREIDIFWCLKDEKYTDFKPRLYEIINVIPEDADEFFNIYVERGDGVKYCYNFDLDDSDIESSRYYYTFTGDDSRFYIRNICNNEIFATLIENSTPLKLVSSHYNQDINCEAINEQFYIDHSLENDPYVCLRYYNM